MKEKLKRKWRIFKLLFWKWRKLHNEMYESNVQQGYW